SQSGNYPNGQSLTFSLAHGDVDAEGSDNGDTSDVSGTVTGNKMTISTSGIEVNGTSNNSETTTLNTSSSSYGTYSIKFDVTAGDDDHYIRVRAGTTTGSITGVVYTPNAANAFTVTASAVLTSSADKDTSNNFYPVNAGETESFALTVTLDPSAGGTYEVD